MSQPQILVQAQNQTRQDVITIRVSLDARLVRVSNKKEFERMFKHKKAQRCTSRLVPWVNGVKWREANGLEKFKPKDKRIRSNGAAMAGPLNQNPKKRRPI